MAVLGSLLMLAFSALLTFSQRMDGQVEMKMEAFRKALNRSYARNASVSYTVKKDKRFYNLMGGFLQSEPSTMAASASVMWQKGMSGCQHDSETYGTTCENDRDNNTSQSSFAYYEVNNQLIGVEDTDVLSLRRNQERMLPRYKKYTKTHTGDDVVSKVPASVWRDETVKEADSTVTSRKEERPGPGSRIDNRQTLVLNENIRTQVFLRYDTAMNLPDDDIHLPDYAYDDEGFTTRDEDGDAVESVGAGWGPSEARQGAYYNNNVNRIEYDPQVGVNDELIIERNWRTNFD